MVVASEVILCTGGLQRSRQIALPGEAAFCKGPVLEGFGGRVDQVDFKNKRVVVLGMGSFGIENARTALFGGAEHVTILNRTINWVVPRLMMYMSWIGTDRFERMADIAKRTKALA